MDVIFFWLILLIVALGWLPLLIVGIRLFRSSRPWFPRKKPGIVLALFGLVWLFALVGLSDAVPAVREEARIASCQSNLKQIGLAITQYTQDADEQLPPNLKATFPFGKSEAIYICPFGGSQCEPCYHDPVFPAERYRYIYQPPNAVKLSEIPPGQALVWDNVPHPNLHPIFPLLGSRTRSVLSLNGYVTEMTEADFQARLSSESRKDAKSASRSSRGN